MRVSVRVYVFVRAGLCVSAIHGFVCVSRVVCMCVCVCAFISSVQMGGRVALAAK